MENLELCGEDREAGAAMNAVQALDSASLVPSDGIPSQAKNPRSSTLAVLGSKPNDGLAVERSSRLSVIVPCYNEAPTVVELLRRVRAALPLSQIIVVDDGSTDGSPLELRSVVSELHVETCLLPENRGKGAAFRAGLARADREFVVIQDADLEYDPQDIDRLLSVAIGGGWDAVYGSRYLTQRRRQRGSRWNYLAVRFLALVLFLKHRLRLSDPATCYKLFRRDHLQAVVLRSEGFELCQELNRVVAEQQWRVMELPIGYHPRSRAEGKKIRAVDFWFALRALFLRSSCIVSFALLSLLFTQDWLQPHECRYFAIRPAGRNRASNFV